MTSISAVSRTGSRYSPKGVQRIPSSPHSADWSSSSSDRTAWISTANRLPQFFRVQKYFRLLRPRPDNFHPFHSTFWESLERIVLKSPSMRAVRTAECRKPPCTKVDGHIRFHLHIRQIIRINVTRGTSGWDFCFQSPVEDSQQTGENRLAWFGVHRFYDLNEIIPR